MHGPPRPPHRADDLEGHRGRSAGLHDRGGRHPAPAPPGKATGSVPPVIAHAAGDAAGP
jgi:hypothetical protein